MLTSDQKHDILFELGYDGKVLDENSTRFLRPLFTALDNLYSRTETHIIGLLADILDIRTKIKASTSRMLTKQVGDIQLNNEEYPMLLKELYRLKSELSKVTGIPQLQTAGSSRMIGILV